MSWLTLTFRSDPRAAPELADLLSDAGALAVTFHDGGDAPVVEPGPGETPLWPDTLVEALFEEREPGSLVTWLRDQYRPADLPSPTVGRVEDRDWARAGMDQFRPVRFGDCLWVCPSWSEPPDPQGVNLRLDPGLAFGTGGHPTTALCLEWLSGAPLAGTTLVDYGCGSGILGVAALLLGAARVWATDHDPQALLASHETAARNGVLERLTVVAPECLPSMHVDVVVANILAGPLVQLAPRLTRLVGPGGALVLSGVLVDQAPQLMAAYLPWVPLGLDAQRDGWARLVGRRATATEALCGVPSPPSRSPGRV